MCTVAVLVASAGSAFATTGRYYVGPTNGNFNNAANWSATDGGPGGEGVPTTANDAIADNNSASPLSFNLDADASVQSFVLDGSHAGAVGFNQSAHTLTLAQNLNLGGGTFGVSYNQSGGAVIVGGTLFITGPSSYNLTGGTLSGAIENDNVITVSNGATLNASSIAGSGQIQYVSSANLAGGDLSAPITTAANTIITKIGTDRAIISGVQTYGVNTTYEADNGPTTFQSVTGSSFASANLSIHGNTTKITFNIAPVATGGGTPQVRPTYVKGLQLNTPGEAILAAGGQQVLGTSNLSIDVSDGGSMDVNDNTFLYESATADHNAANIAQLTSYLHTGYNGGAWNGLGIFSTTASQTFGRAVGLLNNDDGSGNAIYTTFHTAPVDAHTALVQYTYAGDSDLDGADTSTDFSRYVAGLQTDGTTWAQGDFTYDGTVDLQNDFRQLAEGWYAEYGNDATLAVLVNTSTLTPGQKIEADAIIAGVPEPTTAAVLLPLAAFGLCRRRRD